MVQAMLATMKRRRGRGPDSQRYDRLLRATPTDPTSETSDIRWARAILDGARNEPPGVVDTGLAAALVDALVERADTGALAWLATLDSRLAKAARAGAHRLRTRGVEVELPRTSRVPASTDGAALIGGERRLCEGIITPYDQHAHRLIWVAQPVSGQLSWLHAIVSARTGLIQLSASLETRKTYRQALRELREIVEPVRVDVASARWLISAAAKHTTQAGRALPEEAIRALRELGPVPEGMHPALQIEPAEADINELKELYELAELASWVPDQQTLQQIALRSAEVETSQLLIDEQQRARQIAHAIERAVDDYFADQANRSAARRVLLDTAHLVSAAGRGAQAAALRAAADLFELEPDRIVAHPFARHFIERWVIDSSGALLHSASGALDEDAGDPELGEPQGGLILPP
jgi:hypothetical protein